MAPRKETNFFVYQNVDQRMPEYERQFQGAEGAKAVGEFSVRYLASSVAPLRVRRYIPDARIIVSLRNPIDQINSHYWHLQRQNFHQWQADLRPGSLEEALERFPQYLLEPAYYHRNLQRWVAEFDRTQILILLYDDICNCPERIVGELYRHVGVDPDFRPPTLHERGSKVRRGTSPRGELSDGIRALTYGFLNRWIYYPLKRVFGVSAAYRLQEAFGSRKIIEGIFRQEGYPVMSVANRDRIRSLLAEEIRGVEEMTGRDLSAWR